MKFNKNSTLIALFCNLLSYGALFAMNDNQKTVLNKIKDTVKQQFEMRVSYRSTAVTTELANKEADERKQEVKNRLIETLFIAVQNNDQLLVLKARETFEKEFAIVRLMLTQPESVEFKKWADTQIRVAYARTMPIKAKL